MKMRSISESMRCQTERPGGSALILILAVIVVLLATVLIFFTLVTSERTESSAFRSQVDSRQLSTTAVDLVKATISQGTTLPSGVSWASQPGMIRTWNSDGNAESIYRLYSSPELVDEASGFSVADEANLMNNWRATGPVDRAYNAKWCDLNSPLPDSTGRLIYPIATPPVALVSSGTNVSDVQGYSASTTSALGWNGGAPSARNNPVPMPTQWLYVLQDGTITSANTGGSGAEVTVSGATSANPIVGRIAYWTDDDTSKVNVNTATEGNFWCLPRGTFAEDLILGQRQPARNEFNRYPGHPMTTSLSAVFPDFEMEGKPTISQKAAYLSLPRGPWGGSLLGSLQPSITSNDSDSGGAVSVNNERLFASVDEFAYRPDRSPRAEISDMTRVTPEAVQARSFFLTANSQAPEATLFDTPRVSMWPINSDGLGASGFSAATRQDAFDKTLRFCATLNDEAYYFLRSDPWSATYDYSNIPRNQKLYSYLQDMTSRRVPGFGGSFSSKYGPASRNALLTQTFDFIRSSPNLFGASFITSGANHLQTGGYTIVGAGTEYSLPYVGTVVPITINDTRGMGNSPFIHEVAVAFVCEKVEALDQNDAVVCPTAWDPTVISGLGGGGLAPSNLNELIPDTAKKVRYTIRPVLLFSAVSPSYSRWRELRLSSAFSNPYTANKAYRVRVMNTDDALGWQVMANQGNCNGAGGGPMVFPWEQWAEGRYRPEAGGSSDGGPTHSFSTQWFLFETSGGVPTGFQTGANGRTAYVGAQISMTFDLPPAIVATLPLPSTDPNAAPRQIFRLESTNTATTTGWNPEFNFSGGTLELQFAFGDPTSPTVLQDIQVKLEGLARLPVPFIVASPLVTALDYANLGGALDGPKTTAHKNSRVLWKRSAFTNRKLLTSGDVVRSSALTSTGPSGGDWRLAMLQPPTRPIPTTWFSKVESPPGAQTMMAYDKFDQFQISSMGDGVMNGWQFYTTTGRVVKNLNWYNGNKSTPAASYDLNGAFLKNGAPGDWTAGISTDGDGATFNMPPPGGIGRRASSGIIPSYYNMALSPDSDDYNAKQFKLMYSPHREMYSPMQMGALLTGVASDDPWQTLLFCPNSAAVSAGSSHPGAASPPDHLFADLFWMPVVDPYPISVPLATAGKVNMNYQIMPFTHIQRKTGLYAALKATKIKAIADIRMPNYKLDQSSGAFNLPSGDNQSALDIAETLKGFDAKFQGGDIFRSATQICDMWLYPQGQTYSSAGLGSWWSSRRLTGDNVREEPYAALYPRLTTKSNTFTVHFRVQSLKQRSVSSPGVWQEGKDVVLAEYRGSTTIERYVDPNDTALPDFATDDEAMLGPYYRWRTLQERQFVP